MLLRDICCLIIPWKDAFSQKMSDSILLKATVPAFLALEFMQLFFFPSLFPICLFIYFFNFWISSSEMLYLLNDSEDQSFRLWIMTIISIMQIVYSSGMATYSVGASAKMWSPFFKNDGMFKMVTAEHWSHCRRFSVRVPYGCPGCKLGSRPWSVAIFLAADSFPLPLLQAKTRWPTKLMKLQRTCSGWSLNTS